MNTFQLTQATKISGIAGLVFLLLSFVLTTITLDLQLHDTYLIFPYNYIIRFCAITLLVAAVWYQLSSRLSLSDNLTFMHLGFTIGGTLVVALCYPIFVPDAGYVSTDLFGTISFTAFLYATKVTAIAVLVVVAAQILLPVNTLRAALRS